MSIEEDIIFIKTAQSANDSIDIYTHITSVPNRVMIKPLRLSDFLSLKMNDGKPENDNSILGCLYREIIKSGYKPNITLEENIGRSAFVMNDGLVVRSTIE